MCLWSCLPDFFFFTQQLKLQIGAARVFPSCLSFSSFSRLVAFKTHRRTKHHQLGPMISAEPQKSNVGVREAHGELLLHLVRFFSEEKREREGEVWDSSCSFPRLTPPFGLLPPLLTASLLYKKKSCTPFQPSFFFSLKQTF